MAFKKKISFEYVDLFDYAACWFTLNGTISVLQDHINFTIGRQSFNLKQLENASAAFKHLLTVDSKQTPPQQAAFLREYLFVFKVRDRSLITGGGGGGASEVLPL